MLVCCWRKLEEVAAFHLLLCLRMYSFKTTEGPLTPCLKIGACARRDMVSWRAARRVEQQEDGDSFAAKVFEFLKRSAHVVAPGETGSPRVTRLT